MTTADSLKCIESMPPFVDFSTLPVAARPSIVMLPHIVTSISYIALQEGFAGVKTSAVPTEANARCRQPSVLDCLLTKLECRDTSRNITLNQVKRITRKKTLSKKPTGILKESPRVLSNKQNRHLRKLREVSRLRSLGMPTWPIEQDIPLSYDWDGLLGEKSTAGSAGWNRLLLLLSVLHSRCSCRSQIRFLQSRCRIPQVSALQHFLSLKNIVECSSPSLIPPPFCATMRSVHIPPQVYENSVEDRGRSYAQECHLLSPEQVRSCLFQFHETARLLKERQEELLVAENMIMFPGNSSQGIEVEVLSRQFSTGGWENHVGNKTSQSNMLVMEKVNAWKDSLNVSILAKGESMLSYKMAHDEIL